MMVVSRIYVGHKIVTADDTYEVVDNMKLRSGYKYLCRTRAGEIVRLDREDVLQAQRDGDARVTA